MLPLKDRKPADGQPTRWNWLKHKAKKKADDLENKIKSGAHFTELREALKEVKVPRTVKKDEKPYQQFLWRGARQAAPSLKRCCRRPRRASTNGR